ncbi:hypothetical protein KBX31_05380, partial [Liquorilactobacillus satsumensis]|uniref:hypothetical protein n=1 Tax=Liquorilactobacillus satsumensis TaxID=259059 RepID=UPI0021C29785
VFESTGSNQCFFIFNYTKRASPEKSLLSLVKLFHLGTYGTAPFLFCINELPNSKIAILPN